MHARTIATSSLRELSLAAAPETRQDRDMTEVRKESAPATEVVPLAVPRGGSRLIELTRLLRGQVGHFLRIEAASSIVLLAAAALALGWANSPWAERYRALWHTAVGFHVGQFGFEQPLEWLVNDVLMVIFFFVVAMEIRVELHDGELSEWRRAALPAIAAIGGMIAPAGVYLLLARGSQAHSGWGVPMATDIAFAVGVLALLGKRVPSALRALLLALAVIDDLGAILVIAIFYSSGIAASGLLVAALGVALLFVFRGLGLRSFPLYVLPALVVWLGVHAAGIHPTIAGVIVGLLTPVSAGLGPEGSVDAASPAKILIGALQPWVAFGIMPVFAFANAGVSLHGIVLTGVTARVGIAVALALVLGKPLGVIAVSSGAIWLRLAALPKGLTVRHLVVLGIVAGIGFTMSLFIAQLAFADPSLLAAARLGVLAASALAMIVGLATGCAVLRSPSRG